MSEQNIEKRRAENAQDRETLRRRRARRKAIEEQEVQNDAPHLDRMHTADRKGGRLVPLDKLFKS